MQSWYEKLALEGHAFVLQQENNRKDEVIGQLRIELEQRGAPHFLNQPPQAHNKSTSHHPSFSVPNQPSPNSTAHWNAVHPNRNFTIGQPRNF
uniref:Predicted protein n=1 Tax=Hordeum vulgare subsp. vulgare TaxID=112509 RepID=F2DGE1_HORVV|nr:predicted protein [Hordeum vulgare subsp. vulgare]